MENFISSHFALFLTITIFLIFALIGYIYDTKKNKEDFFKKNEAQIDEEAIANLSIPEGKGLNDTVLKSKNINPETGGVELVDSSILNKESNNVASENDIKS